MTSTVRKIRPTTRTYHGKPCKNCSETLKYASCGACVDCNKAKNLAWTAANPEKTRGYMRKSWLKRWYGITPEDYDAMFAAQDGKCAICLTSDPAPWTVFGVDHNHETGKVRGLLCDRCNSSIARLDEDIERMHRAIAYLERDAA